MMIYKHPKLAAIVVLGVLIAVVGTGYGILRFALAGRPLEQGPDITAYLKVERNIGVGFGFLPEDTDEVSVSLVPTDGWLIASSGAFDPSGTTIWELISAEPEEHYWEGCGHQAAFNTIINSGASVLFAGKLYKPGPGPGEPPDFKASVADLDIDVDSSQPPRHQVDYQNDHWPPYAEEETENGEAEDESEDTESGGLYLPASLYEGDDFPATVGANDPYKILNVQIRTKYQGGLQNDDPCLTYVGKLAFDVDGEGIALYDSSGFRVTGSTEIQFGGINEQYRILTNDEFTQPGGITATFQWRVTPDSYNFIIASGDRIIARDYVRLAPLGVRITSLDPDTDIELGEDLTVEYKIDGPTDFSSAELQVHNESDVLIFKKTGLNASVGTHTTTWEDAKWNQSPHSGAYANPNNGDYKVKIIAQKGESTYTSNIETIDTKFVIEADAKDEQAGTASRAAGLDDLGDALEVVVVKDATTHTFSSADLTLTNIADGKHLKVDNDTLNSLDDGEWTVQLQDVRDEIGNFYDSNSGTQDIDHYEWTIELR